MLKNDRLRIAIQKKGRLFSESIDLLTRCGLKIHIKDNALITRAENLPIDILLVRDDDIPTLIMDNICDLGIVGENVLFEKALSHERSSSKENYIMVRQLGFGNCRLAIAFPDEKQFSDFNSLNNLRIATSYPNLLTKFLTEHNINAEILDFAGSVEITPRLGMADAICDLVSTGRTLEDNNLIEVATIVSSQAVLIKTAALESPVKNSVFELLLRRINGVLTAQESKYIMFHAPKSALAKIKDLLPGFESPTVIPLEQFEDKVAVHVVSGERIFWETLEKLKQAGASSILVLPIEKMLG